MTMSVCMYIINCSCEYSGAFLNLSFLHNNFLLLALLLIGSYLFHPRDCRVWFCFVYALYCRFLKSFWRKKTIKIEKYIFLVLYLVPRDIKYWLTYFSDINRRTMHLKIYLMEIIITYLINSSAIVRYQSCVLNVVFQNIDYNFLYLI